MKRPRSDTPQKPAKRKHSLMLSPIKNLQERLETAELDATFNIGFDEISLDELYVLLVDMIAGIETHGKEPDEAFEKVVPGDVWRDYLRMWREQHLRTLAVAETYAKDPDDVFYHADAVARELQKRERIAWRVYLCQRVLAPELTDAGLRSQLEALRFVKSAPRKRAA